MRPEPDNRAVSPHRTGTSALDRHTDVVIAGHRNDVSVVFAGLEDRDASVRAAAVGALGRLSSVPDAERLAGWLTAAGDPNPTVRQRAALVAPQLRVVESTHLHDLLLDDDDRVVETSCFAVGEIEPPDAACIERLATIVETHSDSLCREAAVAALGSLGVPEGLASVLRGCSDKATVRRRAVLALANYDGEEVADMLRRLTTDRDLQVRQSAEDLLAIAAGHNIGGGDIGGGDML